MPERFRGIVTMPHDENNEHSCTGCQACEIACPNGSIEINWTRELNPETGKKKKDTRAKSQEKKKLKKPKMKIHFRLFKFYMETN